MFTIKDLIAQAERALADAQARRAGFVADQEGILAAVSAAARESLTAEEQTRFDALSADKRAVDVVIGEQTARLEQLRGELAADERAAAAAEQRNPGAPTPRVRVTSEPETYRRGGEASYFRDLFRASNLGDREAVERLVRNDAEVRALSTTDGAGGEFVPPVWMINEFVELARAGRVVADAVRQETLPGGTDTISLPRIATGTAAAQQTQGSNVQETDATTDSVSATVYTIAGGQTVNQQLLDQSPINLDPIILADLAADYAVKLDTAVINSSNTNGKGLLQVTGINAVTYTDASPTVAELYPKVADGIQQIHTGRFLPPEKIFMHPRRWAWFLSALDSSGRPLVTPAAQMPQNVLAAMSGVASDGFVGTLQGLPVYVDPNIPINLGGSTNEDRIIIARTSDVILYEGSPRAEAFRETSAKALQVFFRFHNYYALHSARLPKAISAISGTGLATPSF